MEQKSKINFRKLRSALPELVIVFIFLFLIAAVGYWAGYDDGKIDGYVDGYMNNELGLYDETASQKTDRNLFEELIVNIPGVIEDTCDFVLDAISAEKYQNETFVDFDYIYANGRASKRHVSIVVNELQFLPRKLLERFEDGNWRLILTDQDIVLDYAGDDNYKAAGTTNVSQQEIVVAAESISIKYALVHEFGHYFDYANDRPSNSDEWKKCYIEEWENFYLLSRSFHSVGTATEYFADSFEWYLKNPEKFGTHCPKSFEFIETLLEQYT